MVGVLIIWKPTFIFQSDASEIDEQYSDDNDEGWRTFFPDQLINNFCYICMSREEQEDLLECNSCRIGLHRGCCLESKKYSADDISDTYKTIFCDYCEGNVSDDDSEE